MAETKSIFALAQAHQVMQSLHRQRSDVNEKERDEGMDGYNYSGHCQNNGVLHGYQPMRPIRAPPFFDVVRVENF